jgi:hypothetical protein
LEYLYTSVPEYRKRLELILLEAEESIIFPQLKILTANSTLVNPPKQQTKEKGKSKFSKLINPTLIEKLLATIPLTKKSILELGLKIVETSSLYLPFSDRDPKL